MRMTAMQADPVALRALRALPDALLAAVFLWVWLDPAGWRHPLLAQGLLIIIFEFLLLLSSISLLPIVFSHTEPRPAGDACRWCAVGRFREAPALGL